MENQKKVIFSLAVFVLWLLPAYFFKWYTGDLVWSLWLSSITVGNFTIAAVIYCVFILAWDPLMPIKGKQKWDRGQNSVAGVAVLAVFSSVFIGIGVNIFYRSGIGFAAMAVIYLGAFAALGIGELFYRRKLKLCIENVMTKKDLMLISAARWIIFLMVFSFVCAIFTMFHFRHAHFISGFFPSEIQFGNNYSNAAGFMQVFKNYFWALPAGIIFTVGKFKAAGDIKALLGGAFGFLFLTHALIFVLLILQKSGVKEGFLTYVIAYFLYAFPWEILRKKSAK